MYHCILQYSKWTKKANLNPTAWLRIGCLVAASTLEEDRGREDWGRDSISGTASCRDSEGLLLLETKLKSKLRFPAADFWREICPLKLCHHGWLTSSCSRIPLEHIMGNKFYSPSCMMFWGIHWGGRWDLWCMIARFWCYCKPHERLVLSDSPGSTQWCSYVKNALKF